MRAPDDLAIPFTVLVCRACCCGRETKHPEIDHEQQLERLQAAVHCVAGARLRVVDCLDVCTKSNVVVIRDRRPNIASESRSTWLGGIVTDAMTNTLCEWIEDGGPIHALPTTLKDQIFFGPSKDVPRDLQDEDCDRKPRRRIPVSDHAS
jgi:hypothetical protein